MGYYQPTMFKYAYAYAKKCQVCKKYVERENKITFPLHLVLVDGPFHQWGLEIIGNITPNSSQLHKYILTMTNYFTRWTEDVPLKKVNENQVISFLEHSIITRVGIPNYLIFYNSTYF